jgi:hypothetical protein
LSHDLPACVAGQLPSALGEYTCYFNPRRDLIREAHHDFLASEGGVEHFSGRERIEIDDSPRRRILEFSDVVRQAEEDFAGGDFVELTIELDRCIAPGEWP